MDLTKLYPYQAKTARALSARVFGADLSEVGTGKTITALAVMSITNASAVLIVAPKSVVEQWERKALEFYPALTIYRAGSVDRKARQAMYARYGRGKEKRRALIVTYEQVRADIDILKDFKFSLTYADEAHRLGNPQTKLYKSFQKLSSERRFCATATPLRSSPLQAYGIFNWLNPGMMGKNYFHFQFQYTVKHARGWILGYRNLEQLGELIKPHFIKNTMAEVGVMLPPLVEEDVIFDLGASERRLYDNIRKEMLLEIEEQEINKIDNPTSLYNTVVKLGKLQELTDHSLLIGESVESTKLSVLKEHLEDTLVGDNKAVVFTRFSRMADILQEALADYNPAKITGATVDRQGQIDLFDNNEQCKVMIVTTAGNEGINLQRANLLYMYDVPMGSYGSLVQTIGRINRIGQKRAMVVYFLTARDTVDVKLRQLLEKKKDMSERIFGSLQDVRNVLE